MNKSEHLKAIFLAFLVTFLWSTSFILIKLSLQDIPPLTFAGLRYTLAALVLFPGLMRHQAEIRSFSKVTWFRLGLLGLVFYSITQGAHFLALNRLDTVTLSLLLNFSVVFVAILSYFVSKEIPTKLQWLGIVIFFAGVLIYFYPSIDLGGIRPGLIFAGIAVGANAVGSLLGRSVNHEKLAHPVVVTGISMGVGAIVMLVVGLLVEDFPKLSFENIAVIFWLGIVNTAFAFSLWNKSLQTLTAVESSLIANTMLIQIAVLSWIFLDEKLNINDLVGLAVAAFGVLLAHLRPRVDIIPPDLK
jgi:drug/metabolite transporter (DMT)-like permease